MAMLDMNYVWRLGTDFVLGLKNPNGAMVVNSFPKAQAAKTGGEPAIY